jgi:hypothetical protein
VFVVGSLGLGSVVFVVGSLGLGSVAFVVVISAAAMDVRLCTR